MSSAPHDPGHDAQRLLDALERVRAVPHGREAMDAVAREAARLAGFGAALLTIAVPGATHLGAWNLSADELAHFESRAAEVALEERLENRRRIRRQCWTGTGIAFVPAKAAGAFNVLPTPRGRRAPASRTGAAWDERDALFIFVQGTMLPESGLLSLDAPLDGQRPNEADQDALRLAERFLALSGSILEAHVYLESLRGSEEQLRTVIHDLSELVVRHSADGRISFVSPSFHLLCAAQVDDPVGSMIYDCLPDPRVQGIWRGAVASLEPHRPTARSEHDAPLSDGNVHWLEWLLRGQFDDRGQLLNVQAVGRDITQRKQVEDDLGKALTELKRLRDRLQEENLVLREEIRGSLEADRLLGSSEVMKELRATIAQVAAADVPVLVTGETGSGKELVVRALHDASARASRPLLKVNCAAISAGLIESELFGHERGAFTGAHQRRKGRFEIAHRGALFLDEVAELPLDAQAKLLRVLEEGEFERVGSSTVQHTDVRIYAATNRDLETLVAEGRFRSDLYYRLNVVPVAVPPLRARLTDVPELAQHFLATAAARLGRRLRGFSDGALERLQGYAYPGNVRELRNLVERSAIAAQGDVIHADAVRLETSVGGAAAAPPATEADARTSDSMEAMERAHVVRVLDACDWVIEGPAGAARRLDLEPSTLRSRMKRLGIRRPSARDGA